jgi:hypothetical protein
MTIAFTIIRLFFTGKSSEQLARQSFDFTDLETLFNEKVATVDRRQSLQVRSIAG